jgi:hypothetical protein
MTSARTLARPISEATLLTFAFILAMLEGPR